MHYQTLLYKTSISIYIIWIIHILIHVQCISCVTCSDIIVLQSFIEVYCLYIIFRVGLGRTQIASTFMIYSKLNFYLLKLDSNLNLNTCLIILFITFGSMSQYVGFPYDLKWSDIKWWNVIILIKYMAFWELLQSLCLF